MRVLGIIPARAGSKRVPRKNLRPLHGKPLVAWAIEAAIGARRIDRLVVSSDDEEVLEIARRYDPRLPLRRPAELADDTSLAIDYVRHALAMLEQQNGDATAQQQSETPASVRPPSPIPQPSSPSPSLFDAVAIVQPSSPLTTAADIDATIALLDASGADTTVSVVEVDHALHPTKFKTLRGDRMEPFYEEERGRMAAHELPRVYVRNCSVYAIRRSTIERGQIIGPDCRGYVMPRERSIDINDEMDLAIAEWLVSRRN